MPFGILVFCMLPEDMASCGTHYCTAVPLYHSVPFFVAYIYKVCKIFTPTPSPVLDVVFDEESNGGSVDCDM